MQGYWTGYGYKGFIPNKGYMLFENRDEYEQYYTECKEDDEHDEQH